MNLMLLPLTLQVASSGTSIFLAMLLLGIALDKVYVLLSLVSTLPLDGYYEPRWLYRASDNDLFDGSRFSESCWTKDRAERLVACPDCYFCDIRLRAIRLHGVVLIHPARRMCRHRWRCGNLRVHPHVLVARIPCADKLYVGEDWDIWMSSCHRDERLASLFADVGPAERKRFRFHADIDSKACVPGRKCILHWHFWYEGLRSTVAWLWVSESCSEQPMCDKSKLVWYGPSRHFIQTSRDAGAPGICRFLAQ